MQGKAVARFQGHQRIEKLVSAGKAPRTRAPTYKLTQLGLLIFHTPPFPEVGIRVVSRRNAGGIDYQHKQKADAIHLEKLHFIYSMHRIP